MTLVTWPCSCETSSWSDTFFPASSWDSFSAEWSHDRILDKRDTARRLAGFYQRGLDRLGNRWAGKGSAGTEFLDKQHPYAIDLDIFGTGSLFEFVNTAQTQAGRTRLAQWLLKGAEPGEIAARQTAVAEMRGKLDLREELAVRRETHRRTLIRMR